MRERACTKHGNTDLVQFGLGHAAFTLVELLVVVSIISILIALLLPALVAARRQAHTIICAAHLRSVGQALTMYTERYGYYPSCEIGDSPKTYAIWPVRLRPFTAGDQGVFYCPAQDERCKWDKVDPQPGAPGRATEGHAAFGYEVGEPLLDEEGTFFSYGYNCSGAGSGGPGPPDERHLGLGEILPYNPPASSFIRPSCELRANRVRSPSEMIAVTDSTADGAVDQVAFPSEPPEFARTSVKPGDVHNRGANVLFCDGHVQWFPQKGLILTYNAHVVSEDPIRRMWNNNNKINLGPPFN